MQTRRTFQIIETLGKGGFGTVYRARMTDAGGFSKQVALKVMHYDGDAADEMARRMRDEARVLGLIRHRAIVGVTGLVPLDKGWGVVMDYIEGVELTTALKVGRLPTAVAIEIVEEVAAALDAAWTTCPHEGADPLRLVHRDIKPANIRVTRQGEVKLLDFGVARAEFGSREAEENPEFVMGSTRYMAPERRRGVEGHKGDIYGVGIVLANLLTAKRFKEPPEDPDLHARFVGTVLETVQAVALELREDEARRAFGDVRLLLLEMLAFDPHDRPDGAAVARRLRRFRKQLPPPWLRDWADNNVPRLILHEERRLPDESDTGKTFVETPREASEATPTPSLGAALSTTEASSDDDPPAPRSFVVEQAERDSGRLLLWGLVAVAVLAAGSALAWMIWHA